MELLDKGSMKTLLIFVLLLAIPQTVMGERGSFDAKVIDLEDQGQNEFILHLIQLSEPFGYKHKQDEDILIHLRFKCPLYECPDDGDNPSLKKYLAAITLLKKQIAASKKIKFGIVDRGYAKIDGKKNEFQSNGLDIYDGVVYSDYDYFNY